MNHTKYLFIISSLLAVILFMACNNNRSTEKTSPAAIQNELNKKVTDWNEDLNKKDWNALSALYADSISFYGNFNSKENVLKNKHSFLNKNPEFAQKIQGNISLTKIAENTYKASFRKSSTLHNKTSEVDAYLTFKLIGEDWKIVSESDAVTERNISKKHEPKTEVKISNCEDLAEAILSTSPYFQNETKGLAERIIKNGGTSFGTMLEESPGTFEGETYDSYDFNLHEMYPDRMVVIDRFQYNPKLQKLYHYDVALDSLIEIDFDKSLLANYPNLCR